MWARKLLHHIFVADRLLAGKKIAVEVDGPFHFSVNTNSPLGQTMIRRRLLRAVGWTVISVPYHTWCVRHKVLRCARARGSCASV